MVSSDNGSYFDPPLERYADQYFTDMEEIKVVSGKKPTIIY